MTIALKYDFDIQHPPIIKKVLTFLPIILLIILIHLFFQMKFGVTLKLEKMHSNILMEIMHVTGEN